MGLYSFYPINEDGTALAFTAVILEDDDAAVEHARGLRHENGTCAEVVIWEGRRLVFTLTGPRPRGCEPG